MVKNRKNSPPSETGRAIPDIDFETLEKTFLVSQDILDKVLTTDRIESVRGISLMMSAKTLLTSSSDTKTHEFTLLYANVPEPSPIAKMLTETVSYSNTAKLTTYVSISATSIVKHRGADTSKATHILAAMVGHFHAKNIESLASKLTSEDTIEVRLLLDTDRDDRNITSFWELESSLERVLSPYSKPKSDSTRIKLTSTM